MSNDVLLNNLSDDVKIKQYLRTVLMPRIFNNIPITTLNSGLFSLISEYLSQTIEQQTFTNSFFFNESFITKAVLPDSVYSHAAIFNLGYGFATPSVCNFLFELKISDIYNNAKYNATTGLYELIIDRDTKFNLSNGNVYSLDYDIMIQYKSRETSSLSSVSPQWNVQYINMDHNLVAVNKNPYLLYKVTSEWLCIFVTASEYVRNVKTVHINTARGIPNDDSVFTMTDNICGFDINYIDKDGNVTPIDHENMLQIHSRVTNTKPYVHYIMDNQQTLRFMYQLNGKSCFVPEVGSSYEYTIYTCHGDAANFSSYDTLADQPKVITSNKRYANNSDIIKSVFVLGGSSTGTNIGSVESVRRSTIEAYNTAMVISSDHDIDEWFKSFFFNNVLYPFFFKRRDDPWGRIWSGFLALKDTDEYIFRTNTLTASIPYHILLENDNNTMSTNEIVIPPGWLWEYSAENRHTVKPLVLNYDTNKIEKASKTFDTSVKDFVFSNPFGMRIQKEPFAMAYFNPWINLIVGSSRIEQDLINSVQDDYADDDNTLYHGTPVFTNVIRTYENNYYKVTTSVSVTNKILNGERLVEHVQSSSSAPLLSSTVENYFYKPTNMYAHDIALIPRYDDAKTNEISFDPDNTYLCVKSKEKMEDSNVWNLKSFWIEDNGTMVNIPITNLNSSDYVYGTDDLWNEANGKLIPVDNEGTNEIKMTPTPMSSESISFNRAENDHYYVLRSTSQTSNIEYISVEMTDSKIEKITDTTIKNEAVLYKMNPNVDGNYRFTIKYVNNSITQEYKISNAVNVYIALDKTKEENGKYYFNTTQVSSITNSILIYAEMREASGSVNYYKLPFNILEENEPMIYIRNTSLDITKNNIRVVLSAYYNKELTGYVEMKPLDYPSNDGTINFDANMIPTDELIDIDNVIHIATKNFGGGDWIAVDGGKTVAIDSNSPELKYSIFIKSVKTDRDPDIDDESFRGYRLMDEYTLSEFSLIQELKEMRSVVRFDEGGIPSKDIINNYNKFIEFTSSEDFKTIKEYIREYNTSGSSDVLESDFRYSCGVCYNEFNKLISKYKESTSETTIPDTIQEMSDMLFKYSKLGKVYEYKDEAYANIITNNDTSLINKYLSDSAILDMEQLRRADVNCNDAIDITDVSYIQNLLRDSEDGTLDVTDPAYDVAYGIISNYEENISEAFETFNVNGGLHVQLVPFVEQTLMTSSRFRSFIYSFTNIHSSIEPVIMTRLEGNNYLDCKLIATYGKPHSYSSDVEVDIEGAYWPDLNVQIEFDVKLYNKALSITTISDLKSIIKTYFMRLTSVHTPIENISLENNIYISALIHELEEHENVAFLKFKGWYTSDKKSPKYMDANTQAIVMKKNTLDDFTTEEMETFVPELFVLDEDGIVINII